MLEITKQKINSIVQDRFKIDLRYLYTGTKWNIIFQILASGSTFIGGLAFANWVSPDVYAQYKYVFTVASLLSAIAPLGLATSLAKYTTEGSDNSFYFAMRQNIILSIPFVIISLLTSLYYFINGNNTLGFGISLIAISYPFINSLTLFASFLNGKQRFKESSLYAGLINASISLSLVFWVFVTKDTPLIQYPLYIIIVSLVVTLCFNLIGYIKSKRFIQKIKEFDTKEFVTYGLHQSTLSFLGVVTSQIDKILVFQLIGGLPLAQYFFAIAIPEQIRSLFKGFTRLIFTRFSNKSLTEIKRGMLKYLTIGFIITFITSIFYILIAPVLFSVLFRQYVDVVFLSQIFTLSLFTIISMIPQTALQVKGLHKPLYLFTTSSNVIQVILNVICIYYWGLWGAVYSQLLGRFISLIIITTLFYLTKDSDEEKQTTTAQKLL